jgi:hypothetical protein
MNTWQIYVFCKFGCLEIILKKALWVCFLTLVFKIPNKIEDYCTLNNAFTNIREDDPSFLCSVIIKKLPCI